MNGRNKTNSDPATVPRASSPASTGGAGNLFEQHVNAYWLALLLVQGIPPVLLDCNVVEVSFQTERLGWHTDDFLIVGDNGSGPHRRLIGQVKRSFTVSAADDECKKAVLDFWQDFQNEKQYSVETDRFVLITFRGTNTLLEHFSGLLDCARSARDATEFAARLTTPGLLSVKAGQYCDEIRRIIGEKEGKAVSTSEVWPLLRVLHVLSLDLTSSTRQTEAAIKNLLAFTATDHNPVAVAQSSWNALLRQSGEGMPEALTFKQADLPESLRSQHLSLAGKDQRALNALQDHSRPILAGIRSIIGKNLHLGRHSLVRSVIEQLELAQVVLISGPAGSGKSGIAKDAIGLLSRDHFTFCFRAEEFAVSHLDQVLQSSQISINGEQLGAILAGQGRKVLLIESVERLLEASTRDAFRDLLSLVSLDKSWQLALTCRDYSTDLVRSALLDTAGIEHMVVTVPLLEDAELDEAKAAYPPIERPLSNSSLRELLRNPYVLDKAMQMPWPADRPLPENERDFRTRFWHDIVRVDQRAAGGMPRRREQVFIQVALQRAQTLKQYAMSSGLDPEVIEGLYRDSLIERSEKSEVLVAPAHDVLEDWAVLAWIDEQYAIKDGSPAGLAMAIGAFPAIRRTYRNWVRELIQRDSTAADLLFQAAVTDGTLPAYFRDDTLVSILRSPMSSEFIDRHRTALFAQDKRLFSRVIRLLRVACVSKPAGSASHHGSLFYVPDGPAWACVLRLIESSLDSFGTNDRLLLLGLLEDWSRGVSQQNPYPEGSKSAVAIAHWLLLQFDSYRSDDQRKRTLQVIAKIPNSDPDVFSTLLKGDRKGEERDPAAEDLREIIFEGLEGMPAARDLPDLVVAEAKRYLMLTDEGLKRSRRYGGTSDLEPLFGIKVASIYSYYPASAYRGPFLHLFRHHLMKGLMFVVALFNHSAEWYSQRKAPLDHVEPPLEMSLIFADGTTRQQWCNVRLWNLYRGTSVGPHVLKSILMALELRLLEVAESQPKWLDELLLWILRQSSSGALTSVVASIATAFPHAAGETILVLLRTPECIRLDRYRFATEAHASTGPSLFGPIAGVNNKLYDDERKQANLRPHRRHDLEAAVMNLQLGPLAPRVQEILDRHRLLLPPIAERNEHDRLWCLALHRMDLRQYKATDHQAQSAAEEGKLPPDHGRKQIILNLDIPEPEIREMVEQSESERQVMNHRLGLSMWAISVYRRDGTETHAPSHWHDRLQEARAAIGDRIGRHDPGHGGPGYVAAVCVRDHWNEMSGDERDWCVDVVCTEVEQEANNWNKLARIQKFETAADRPCSWVLSRLFDKNLSESGQRRVRRAFVIALTHPTDEVRWYATWGIAENIWKIDRDLALRSLNAIAIEASMADKAANEEHTRIVQDRNFERLDGGKWIDQIEAETATIIRQRFFDPNGILMDAMQDLDVNQWFGAKAIGRVLTILGTAPTEPAAVPMFENLAKALVHWWKADDEDEDEGVSHSKQRFQRNPDAESAVMNRIVDFLLRISQTEAAKVLKPILATVEGNPRSVSWVLSGLITAEIRKPSTPQFWHVWSLIAERVLTAAWVSKLDDKHCVGSELMSEIFLGSNWRDDIRHWQSLSGYADHVHSLFDKLPPCSMVLDDYTSFLFRIGDQSLPSAFIRIVQRLKQGNCQQMLRRDNTVYLLEVLLQRFVYGRPLELKRQADLRDAVLELLDILVETGSSAAFRMRDDFVTPIPTN